MVPGTDCFSIKIRTELTDTRIAEACLLLLVLRDSRSC